MLRKSEAVFTAAGKMAAALDEDGWWRWQPEDGKGIPEWIEEGKVVGSDDEGGVGSEGW